MEVREASATYQVEPAYKQTEVGLIPEEWDNRKLEETTDPQRPISYGIVQTGPSVLNGIPCLRVVDIQDGKIRKKDLITTSKTISDAYKRTILKNGDLVMPLRGKVGDVGIVDADIAGANLTRGVALLAIKSQFSSEFFKHYISWSNTRNRLEQSMNGSALQEIPIATLRSFQIAFPSALLEQQAIAAALSDADALIESLEELLAKKRQIKQGAMQELLTGHRRLPGFVGKWEIKRLGLVADMGSGGTPTSSVSSYYDGDIPWVSISDMTKGGKVIVVTDRNLSTEGLANSPAQMFPVGTVLYAMYASLGECSIAGVPLCSSQAILGIRPSKDLSNEYLYYYLTNLKPIVKSLGQQGTQSNLNKGMVQDFRIPMPSFAEQAAIATLLADMDADIAALEAKLAKARELKQGMMQQLLTGRIRLV